MTTSDTNTDVTTDPVPDPDPDIDIDIDIDIVVEVASSAGPEQVWDVIWALERYGEWNVECVEARWLPGWSEPGVGARFSGRNEWNGRTWTVVCHIIECAPPAFVCWTVQDPGCPSSTWSYTITPTERGCTVHQRFVHGPGNSGIRSMVRADPDSADVVIAARTRMLEANMQSGVRAVVRMAEGSGADAGDST
jgi:hypothetical protein